MSEHNEAWMDRLIAAGVALDESKPDELVWTSNALDEALPGYYRGHWRKAINADPTLAPGEDWRVIDGEELRALKMRSDIAQPPASSLWIANKAAIDRLITAHVPEWYGLEEVTEAVALEMEREIDGDAQRIEEADAKYERNVERSKVDVNGTSFDVERHIAGPLVTPGYEFIGNSKINIGRSGNINAREWVVTQRQGLFNPGDNRLIQWDITPGASEDHRPAVSDVILLDVSKRTPGLAAPVFFAGDVESRELLRRFGLQERADVIAMGLGKEAVDAVAERVDELCDDRPHVAVAFRKELTKACEPEVAAQFRSKLREAFEPKHEEHPQFGAVRASICALAQQAAQARVAIERRRDDLLSEVNELNDQIQWLRSFEAHCD